MCAATLSRAPPPPSAGRSIIALPASTETVGQVSLAQHRGSIILVPNRLPEQSHTAEWRIVCRRVHEWCRTLLVRMDVLREGYRCLYKGKATTKITVRATAAVAASSAIVVHRPAALLRFASELEACPRPTILPIATFAYKQPSRQWWPSHPISKTPHRQFQGPYQEALQLAAKVMALV